MPVSIVHLEIEGVERIAAGYGADAAWRMVAAVAAIVSGQLAGQERAFRIGDGQLVVLAPGREPRELVELGSGSPRSSMARSPNGAHGYP